VYHAIKTSAVKSPDIAIQDCHHCQSIRAITAREIDNGEQIHSKGHQEAWSIAQKLACIAWEEDSYRKNREGRAFKEPDLKKACCFG
jgi:hypothetical protein